MYIQIALYEMQGIDLGHRSTNMFFVLFISERIKLLHLAAKIVLHLPFQLYNKRYEYLK